MRTQNTLGLTTTLQMDYEAALSRVTEALKAEGFGVLTEIDVKETLKKKLAVDYPRYKILGACSPPLAHRALTANPIVGLLLPCNVTVAELDDGTVQVAFIDPLVMMGVMANDALEAVAAEAFERLTRVIAALEQ